MTQFRWRILSPHSLDQTHNRQRAWITELITELFVFISVGVKTGACLFIFLSRSPCLISPFCNHDAGKFVTADGTLPALKLRPVIQDHDWQLCQHSFITCVYIALDCGIPLDYPEGMRLLCLVNHSSGSSHVVFCQVGVVWILILNCRWRFMTIGLSVITITVIGVNSGTHFPSHLNGKKVSQSLWIHPKHFKTTVKVLGFSDFDVNQLIA